MKVQCPAKINLFLEVTGKRPDGYHRLATLFAKINVYDVLDITYNNEGKPVLEVESDGVGPLSAGPDNLVARAADAFYKAFDIGQGVNLKLTKRIPMGAGLGGGSSDAAGTLLGLSKFFDMPVTGERRKKIVKIGTALGADVPFFLHPANFCLGTGIGEKLKAVEVHKSLPYMILVYPGFGVATAQAFKALPLPSRSDVLTHLSDLDKLVQSLRKGKPISHWEACLFNRLEEAGLPVLSQVEQVRRVLAQLGARGVRMTGSGSSVFGFVASHAEGERIVKRLEAYPWKVSLTSCHG
jgi:4-diphosphocytidyl-2-C-methyl-D-erythritol kinase